MFVPDNACDQLTMTLIITLQRIMGLLIAGLFQNIQEQTKALVLVFVFVLVDEQAITT